ncbi:hypothetical protein Tco_0032292 [Tanacetum coccineum]
MQMGVRHNLVTNKSLKSVLRACAYMCYTMTVMTIDWFECDGSRVIVPVNMQGLQTLASHKRPAHNSLRCCQCPLIMVCDVVDNLEAEKSKLGMHHFGCAFLFLSVLRPTRTRLRCEVSYCVAVNDVLLESETKEDNHRPFAMPDIQGSRHVQAHLPSFPLSERQLVVPRNPNVLENNVPRADDHRLNATTPNWPLGCLEVEVFNPINYLTNASPVEDQMSMILYMVLEVGFGM